MTSRERTEYLHPPFNIRLGREVGGNLMLIYVMSLSYAAVSPIILPFTLLFFLENWVVWRYQILYTFERCYEAGGIVSPTSISHFVSDSCWASGERDVEGQIDTEGGAQLGFYIFDIVTWICLICLCSSLNFAQCCFCGYLLSKHNLDLHLLSGCVALLGLTLSFCGVKYSGNNQGFRPFELTLRMPTGLSAYSKMDLTGHCLIHLVCIERAPHPQASLYIMARRQTVHYAASTIHGTHT